MNADIDVPKGIKGLMKGEYVFTAPVSAMSQIIHSTFSQVRWGRGGGGVNWASARGPQFSFLVRKAAKRKINDGKGNAL